MTLLWCRMIVEYFVRIVETVFEKIEKCPKTAVSVSVVSYSGERISLNIDNVHVIKKFIHTFCFHTSHPVFKNIENVIQTFRIQHSFTFQHIFTKGGKESPFIGD